MSRLQGESELQFSYAVAGGRLKTEIPVWAVGLAIDGAMSHLDGDQPESSCIFLIATLSCSIDLATSGKQWQHLRFEGPAWLVREG